MQHTNQEQSPQKLPQMGKQPGKPLVIPMVTQMMALLQERAVTLMDEDNIHSDDIQLGTTAK